MESDLNFNSPEEFRELCEHLSAALHAKNRIWLSESGFVWQIAALVDAIGLLFEQSLTDPQTIAEFGDAHHAGRLSPDGRRERLLELLSDLMKRQTA